MSQENVEVVLAMNRAFNRHEDTWVDFYDPDAEYVMPADWPEESVYRGHEGLRRLLAAITAIFPEREWMMERVTDAGDDSVLVLAHVRANVAGQEVEQRIAALSYLDGGKIVRQLTYFTWDEALNAVGVEE
jgi:ketosteroid isomerase-like protein